jgi:hypothetical protein
VLATEIADRNELRLERVQQSDRAGYKFWRWALELLEQNIDVRMRKAKSPLLASNFPEHLHQIGPCFFVASTLSFIGFIGQQLLERLKSFR